MLSWFHHFFHRVHRRSIREHEVARFGTITISDFRRTGEVFGSEIICALKLLAMHDPRRLRRVQNTSLYIVNHVIPDGAPGSYDHDLNACFIDYEIVSEIDPPDFRRACIACLLVHEATHGVLVKCKIQYRGDARLRIERLCMVEQNRFATRLLASAPDAYAGLSIEFCESDWASRWSRSRSVVFLSYLHRYWRK